ncbi:2-oxoglutarate-dependent dioxygenase gloE [Pseudocercospora fuligena]|uniref:2-oxoglutarate-dependent dioxygenase gloE n=1 Tax=Pseudocercospora fuligena TaxID=685502 RepID=A0A8H6VRI1_9PEZI|nr:2-oxoglutarate-dependent dioxygenase gloE [Pseudocercospora fuligena]
MGSITPPSEDQDLIFTNLPPFPSNVPTVPLLRISLSKLLSNDVAEEEKLWRACCDLGFFYLDCRGGNSSTISGDDLLSSANELFDLAEGVFDLPIEEKSQYDMMGENSYFGYKGYGKGVIDKKGTKDRNEFWNISKDDILGISERLKNPKLLRREENREKIRRYMVQSHAVVTMILEKLERRLGLAEGKLRNLHRLEGTSGDQVRWVKSPPQEVDDRRAALGEHTDFGSVTVLFNRLGGLQVLPPDTEEWAYVKPLKGHCVVNLGDAMVKFTAGILRSNMHRVVNPPGEQQNETRYSLVYFNRPEDEVELKVLEGSEMIDKKRRENPELESGEVISAKEWILRRAMGRRAGGDWEKGQGTDKERIEKRDSGVAAS